MRILFINRMMGVSWGGGENYDYHLARGLERLGHEVVMLTGRSSRWPAPPPKDLECISIETPYLRRHMYALAGKVPIVPGLFAEADLWLFKEKAKNTIREILRKRKIDVVQVLALPGMATWLARFQPTAMRFPGPPAWFQSGILRRLGRNRRSRMFTHGDAVRYFHKRLEIDVAEVPPGINGEIFRRPTEAERNANRESLGFGREDFVLTTVGRLIAGKGHEFLLRGLARRRDPRVRVQIVGDGPLRGRFESLAKAEGLGGQVRFTGHADAAGVARYLSASDAFCLFSSYENYSNAALEAMACGLPVIASDVGGFPAQIAEGENGHLIANEDFEMLAVRIRELIENREMRARLSANAERFASRFSWAATARQVEGIYAELSA